MVHWRKQRSSSVHFTPIATPWRQINLPCTQILPQGKVLYSLLSPLLLCIAFVKLINEFYLDRIETVFYIAQFLSAYTQQITLNTAGLAQTIVIWSWRFKGWWCPVALPGSLRQDASTHRAAALPGYHLPSHQLLCLRCPPSRPGRQYLYPSSRCEAPTLRLRIYTYYLPPSTNVESGDEFQENPYMLFLISIFISPGIGNYLFCIVIQ